MNRPESPTHTRPHGFGVRRTTQAGPQTSSPASVFEKLLRAFATGGFTYTDFLAELKPLLATCASPTELLETLQRRELIEPLPEHAHAEVLGLLNDAIERGAAEAAVSAEAQNADADSAPDQMPPDPDPAPTMSPSMEWTEGSAKATTVALPALRNSDLTSIPAPIPVPGPSRNPAEGPPAAVTPVALSAASASRVSSAGTCRLILDVSFWVSHSASTQVSLEPPP